MIQQHLEGGLRYGVLFEVGPVGEGGPVEEEDARHSGEGIARRR